MKIQKNKLQEALEVVKPGLSNTELIEQSTSFAFLGNRVVTYNDNISLSHPIEGLDITGAIRAEELYGFLKKTKQEELDVSITDNELSLKAGKSIIGLLLQMDIVLPLDEVSGDKDWFDLPPNFIENLDFTKNSTSRDMSRRVLTCVHVTPQFVEASDSFQLIRVYEEGYPFENTLIPVENIPEIIKINPSQIAETDGWLHFRNIHDTELSCRVLMDTYPQTTALFEVKGKSIAFPKSMSEILDRAMVFTRQDHALDEQVEIKLKEGVALVHGRNEYGWFKEKVKVKYTGGLSVFTITPSLLQNILKRSNTCILGAQKIRFEGEGWEYVAMLKNV